MRGAAKFSGSRRPSRSDAPMAMEAVAGQVGEELHREAVDGHEHLQRAVGARVGEDRIDQLGGEVRRHHPQPHQTDDQEAEGPRRGDAAGIGRTGIGLDVELGQQLGGAHERAGDDRGEEAEGERDVDDRAGAQHAATDIDDVRDAAERHEREAEGYDDVAVDAVDADARHGHERGEQHGHGADDPGTGGTGAGAVHTDRAGLGHDHQQRQHQAQLPVPPPEEDDAREEQPGLPQHRPAGGGARPPRTRWRRRRRSRGW